MDSSSAPSDEQSNMPAARWDNTPPSQQPNEPAYQPPKNRKKLKWPAIFKASRVYLAEYFVMLVIALSLVVMVNIMFDAVLDYIGKTSSSTWSEGFAYTASLAMVSSIIVLVPVFLLLTKRTEGSETTDPSVKSNGWRKGFLAFFLVVVMLTAIGYGVALVYEVVAYLSSFGLGITERSAVWKPMVTDLFGVLMYGFTAWLYAKDYRSQSGARSRLAILHSYGLVVISLVLMAVYMAVPLRYQRNGFIDQTIVGDLRALSSKIDTYNSDKGRLPQDFDDLDLDKKLSSHIKSYNYTYDKNSGSYELCATFKTNTKDKDSSGGNALENVLTGGYSSYYEESRDDNPQYHSKGKDCFNYDVYSYDDYYKGRGGTRTEPTYQSDDSDIMTN